MKEPNTDIKALHTNSEYFRSGIKQKRTTVFNIILFTKKLIIFVTARFIYNV